MKKSNGFTLIELAIVIIIAGLLIALFTNFLTNFNVNVKQKQAQSDLELISSALVSYLQSNGKFPCPASNTIDLSDSNFGREIDPTCDTVTTGGGVTVASNGVHGDIVIGSVPVRAINIPDENIKDPWGGRYLYAVSALQATDATPYLIDNGAITVEDANGNSLIAPSDDGAFVLLSHGPNSIGAFSLSGDQILPCNTSISPNELENCDNDARFVNTLSNSSADATFFDDMVIYQTGSFLAPDLPAGAVMAFDLPICPAGWSTYTPAVGRSIVGSGTRNDFDVPGNAPANTAAQPVGDGPAESVTYNNGDVGGLKYIRDDLVKTMVGTTEYENRSPYLALLYCRKN